MYVRELEQSLRGDEDGGGELSTFQAVLRFKRGGEKVMAYAWLIEFADLTHVFLFEYAEPKGASRRRPSRPGARSGESP
ncbi:hypothetical protein [Ruania alba]|uniref:Uncharacterized protein n=1 Tax=Ruania alba TaxID=648782 RepID=A0A1H5L0Y8_9MICO|nr:hypothetical protein [Ruania alba]SEE70634.1 hypothetical protein SAMN04488554_2555 [Ruania alba]